MIKKVVEDSSLPMETRSKKPFIVSITGSAEAVRECYQKIQTAQSSISNPLCMEINLSCPNILDHPPPAYSGSSLVEYLQLLAKVEMPAGQPRVCIQMDFCYLRPYRYAHATFNTSL